MSSKTYWKEVGQKPMSRYSDNYKRIKWVERPKPEVIRSEEGRSVNAPYYMPDIKEFLSPMSGKVLSSRKQVQHEERGYGVRQCGELRNVQDYDNTARARERTNDKALERAFRQTLEKMPNVKWDD